MRRVALAVACAVLLAAGCGDEGPRPGILNVELRGGPNARAVKFRVVGPYVSVDPPPGLLAFVGQPVGGDSVLLAAFAPVGDSLNGRIVAVIHAPDVRAASRYKVAVLEVAGPSYSLQTDSLYTLAVVRQ